MADKQYSVTLTVGSNQVDAPVEHDHANPWRTGCPKCEELCLYCMGDGWLFTGKGGWGDRGTCPYCEGDGTRDSYDRGNRRLSQQLIEKPKKASKTKKGML